MHNTMWSAVAGSMYQMRRLDVIANNLANANTPGFRADRMEFSTYLSQVRTEDFAGYRDSLSELNQLISTHTDYKPGVIRQTGNPLDMAIAGDGYFVVQTPDGPLYTRAGNFEFDVAGQIVTGDGFILRGEGGPIQIREGLPFEIDENGAVFQEQDEVGRVQIMEIANPETLQKVGNKRFKASAETRVRVSENPRIMQRALEGSNVDAVREMTHMVQTGRAFESYQRVISLVNNINQQANSKLSNFS